MRLKAPVFVQRTVSFLSIFLFTLLLSGCRDSKDVLTRRIEPIMGTYVEITTISQNKDKAESAIREAFTRMKEIDSVMSAYKPNSEISILNREGALEVSQNTINVIKKALYFSKLTDGALDISYKPVMDIWQEAEKKQALPAADELKDAASLVDYRKILVSGNRIRFTKSGMEVDLSCIAKGYAVDEAIEALKERGIKKALVNAGGDIYALGSAGEDEGWRIGIQDPRHDNKLIALVELEDKAIATSGDYERRFLINGKNYPFIFNPKSSLPARSIMSSTVIANDCASADALSTACFILGPEDAMRLIEATGGTELLTIDSEGAVAYSAGMGRFLREYNYSEKAGYVNSQTL